MSQCIGVGCWVTTRDGMVVFVENAAWKGEQACKVDRPGGHAEPSECVAEEGDTEAMARISAIEVRRELFDCIRREVRDEVNIATELQSQPELLGIVYNHERGGRLCRFQKQDKRKKLNVIFLALDFLIQCSADSTKIRELYDQGGEETDESTDLFFVKLKDIKSDKLEQSFIRRFTPHCAASFHLLKERLKYDLSH